MPDRLRGLDNEKPLVYDGTRLSALIILENATAKKTPILLDLKSKTPRHTDAGKESARYIREELMDPKEKQERELDNKIQEEEDEDIVEKLKAEQTQRNATLNRLKDDRDKLGSPIKWEQATKDNVALERVIKKQRDSATKDWMVRFLCSVDFKVWQSD